MPDLATCYLEFSGEGFDAPAFMHDSWLPDARYLRPSGAGVLFEVSTHESFTQQGWQLCKFLTDHESEIERLCEEPSVTTRMAYFVRIPTGNRVECSAFFSEAPTEMRRFGMDFDFLSVEDALRLPTQWSRPGKPLSAGIGSTLDINSESAGGLHRK